LIAAICTQINNSGDNHYASGIKNNNSGDNNYASGTKNNNTVTLIAKNLVFFVSSFVNFVLLTFKIMDKIQDVFALLS